VGHWNIFCNTRTYWNTFYNIGADWNISCRPCDRNLKDVDVISQRLRRVEQLDRLPSAVLRQLALYGYYEDLEEDITCK